MALTKPQPRQEPIPPDAGVLALPENPALESAIERSRWMLDLQENWDEEGSPPIAEATWDVAASFLRRQAEIYWRHHVAVIPVPHIAPGSDGSIDIHWKTDRFELLVNIYQGPDFTAGFYGEDCGRSKIKGKLDPVSKSAYLPLISCVMNTNPGP
jgi:hypothetical protein